MNMFPKKELIEEVAEIKGISAAFIEKDWFVTQVIQLISAISYEDYTIIFTGGTALSKAYNLINRFSEDVDFRVSAPNLEVISKTQQSKHLSGFKKFVIQQLQTQFEIDESQITARNANRFFSVELNYPTYFSRADVLRPHILVELTVSELNLPALQKPVSSMINQVAKKPSEITEIACINPVESAADKLSAITWRIAERIRGSENDSPDIVRHLHDLAILKDLSLENPQFSNLVAKALERDNNRSELLQGFSMKEKFAQLLNIINNDSAYPNEYKRFVNAMSYAEPDKTPTFQNAIQSVHTLIKKVISDV
jgi:predicted nucleotidyltransferase component of viral defense system